MKTRTHITKRFLSTGLALGGLLAFSACEQQGPAEEIGEEIDEAMESDDLEEAVDEAEEVGEEIEEAASE